MHIRIHLSHKTTNHKLRVMSYVEKQHVGSWTPDLSKSSQVAIQYVQNMRKLYTIHYFFSSLFISLNFPLKILDFCSKVTCIHIGWQGSGHSCQILHYGPTHWNCNRWVGQHFTCCFKTLSLNLSKSVSVFLFFFIAIFLAHEVFSHFDNISPSSKRFRTCFSRAECEILILKSVSHSLLKFMAWRRTPVHGPSTNAWREEQNGGALPQSTFWLRHTNFHNRNFVPSFALYTYHRKYSTDTIQALARLHVKTYRSLVDNVYNDTQLPFVWSVCN